MKVAGTRQPWRVMLVPPRSGAENMARELALLDRARDTGECVFSVYSWSAPTLSFGRNQAARDHYSCDRIRNAGFDVVRRPTGGRSILHHREVTYSVTGPDSFAPSLRAAYDRINRVLVIGLRGLGVDASIAHGMRAIPPGPSPCFVEPGTGEVIAAGKKIVGSAQWRDGGAFLQHGSILIDDDQSGIGDLMFRAPGTEPVVSTLRQVIGCAPGTAEVADRMFAAVRTELDADAPLLDPAELQRETLAHAHQFSDPLWTWRR